MPADARKVAARLAHVHPTYTYGAAWAYPRAVMSEWLADGGGWNYTAGKIVRERAGWGWALGSPLQPVQSRAIVLCVACHAWRDTGGAAGSGGAAGAVSAEYTDASLLVVYVGKSGRYFARVRGHNTLPTSTVSYTQLTLPTIPLV